MFSGKWKKIIPTIGFIHLLRTQIYLFVALFLVNHVETPFLFLSFNMKNTLGRDNKDTSPFQLNESVVKIQKVLTDSE